MKKVVPKPIELCSTKDLIQELMDRCDNGLFIGTKPEQYAPDNYWYEIKGNRIMCAGLVEELKMYVDNWSSAVVSKIEDQEPD